MALDGKPYMRPYSLVEEKVGSSHVSGPTRYYKLTINVPLILKVRDVMVF
jgi:hypothetical protein